MDFAIPGDEFGHTISKRKFRRIAEQPLGLTQVSMGDGHFSGHRVEMFNICLHTQASTPSQKSVMNVKSRRIEPSPKSGSGFPSRMAAVKMVIAKSGRNRGP